jgi:hypothetical protein
MEPDSVMCFDIILPDDMGVIIPGKVEYTILLEPASEETWASLTEAIVRTDENNTVVIPLCFSTYGKRIGQCSERFTLIIMGNDLPTKTFKGGVCVSELPDIDTEDVGDGSTRDGLSDTNLFDMDIKKSVKFSVPDMPVNYTVMVQSHADIVLDLTVESKGRVILSKEVDFKEKEYREVNFTLKAKETGTYNFSIVAKVKDCEGSFCVKKRSGQLIVKQYLQEEAGFTISLFPKNLNIKSIEPVEYRLTITNNGMEDDDFLVDLEISENLTTDFQKKTVSVPKGYEKTIIFNVIPQSVSSLFNITAIVTLGDVVKKDTVYLSTNEMLKDALRNMEALDYDKEIVAKDLNEWYNTYRSSEYGKDLNEYAELSSKLKSAQTQVQSNNDVVDEGTDASDSTGTTGFDWSLLLWVVPIAIFTFIVLFVVSKLRSGSESYETSEY